MKKFIQETREHLPGLNKGLIDRSADAPLEEYLIDTWKSMEIIENLTFLDANYEIGENYIDTNQYIQERAATEHLNKEGKRFTFINDNRVGELTVRFNARCLKVGAKDGEDEYEEKIITKKILTLVPDSDGYVMINGKKKYLIYQMVDASTYNTRDQVVLRTMLSVAVRRVHKELVDTNGNQYDTVIYKVGMFKKDRDILPFYFATKGFYQTLAYMGLEKIVNTVETDIPDDTEHIYFKISSKLYLKVIKEIFDASSYVRSMVGMILEVCTNRLNLDNIFDKYAWTEKIGSAVATKASMYYDRGVTSIRFLTRMLDITHQKNLKVHEFNKRDIFAILRWMMSNFEELRLKDNLDLENKILRYNSFAGALFTFILSDKINRAINIGKNRLTMDNVREIFNFPGNVLISALSKSGLLVYDDRVNDLDVISKLRYSIKGVNSLGNKNDRKITSKFRALHPSHNGRVDICCVGNSDTGTSGLLCPYAETDGLAFSKKNEPELAGYRLEKMVVAYLENKTVEAHAYFENEEEYFVNRENMEIGMIKNLDEYFDKLEQELVREETTDEEE